ncbi:uncharacterized protein LOC115677800 [Syzygium oleosum]|uniref:uncharacterized protein LOC115677800 n=1 Tax=Syzygium oleosum TaxID=219896 RepID=UPI0024B99056|nr:uncharacterized protein LOC115677800 [Syzygium oleosum]
MGNCCAHESASTVWAGDDWELLLGTGTEEEEQEASLREEAAMPYGSGSTSSHGRREQVKIKITRKELRELLKKADMQKLSHQEMVESLLMNATGGGSHRCSAEKHHRSWRPALKSIPEVN